MPQISIVIPLYNQADFIEENIESLAKQSFRDFEVIVVNDGSTDNSLEIVKELKDRYKDLDIKILNQKNCGLSCARNRGIEESGSDLILPLDADDKLREDALLKYLKGFKESGADIVIADTQNFGENDTLFSISDSNLFLLPYENWLSYCGLYKKSVWREVGGYKLNMDGGYEDWEFWISCYERGYKFHFVKEPLFFYRVKKESMFTEAKKKDRFLKNKIVLNHTALYPQKRVYEAIGEVFEGRYNKYFFYSERDSFEGERFVLLEGSFVGYKNFGDILQLKKAVSFYKREGFSPIVLCDVEAIKDREYIESLYEDLGVSDIVFYSTVNYDMRDYGLKLVKKCFVENFHIYGGGFLNRYWIYGYLNLAESVINYFGVKRFTVSGQQVDEEVSDKIESFFKKYPPLIFGCRDRKSFEILKGKIRNLEYSFDDAYEELKVLKSRVSFFEDKRKSVLIHLNLTSYVVEDVKNAILDYKSVLKKIRERFKDIRVYFVVAYNDLKADMVRDTLNAIQTMEDEFKEAFILDFSSWAMKYDSIEIPKNAFMITSSYHLAMFAKVCKMPVFIFSKNDYYSQKREALNIKEESFDRFLDTLSVDEESLREWDKVREKWDEKLREALKGKRDLRRYEYENSFRYTFPFYDKFSKYDLSQEVKKQEYLYEAWKSFQSLKEWLDELDVSKRWIEKQYKSFEEENRKLLSDIKKQKEWILQLERDKRWLEEQRGSFKKENEKLLNGIREYEKWVKELEDSKKWLEGQVENYKKREKELEGEIERYKNSFEELKEWTEVLQKGKDWLEESLSEKDGEIERLKENVSEYERKIRELRNNRYIKALLKLKLINI